MITDIEQNHTAAPTQQIPSLDNKKDQRPSVLLTGATGYVGGRLLSRLQEDNCQIRRLARDKLRARFIGLYHAKNK